MPTPRSNIVTSPLSPESNIPTSTDTLLFLSFSDRVKLALWCDGYTRIDGVNAGRLVCIQSASTDYVSMRELGFIVDAIGYVVIQGLLGEVE